MLLDSSIFSLKKIEQISSGLHSAVLVHCTIHGFSGYICLPSANLGKVQSAFTPTKAGIIDNTENQEASTKGAKVPDASSKDVSRSQESFPGKPIRTRARRTDSGREGSTTIERRVSIGGKEARATDAKAESTVPHSSNPVSPKIKRVDVVTPVPAKRTRRTKLEMEEARSATPGNSTRSTATR